MPLTYKDALEIAAASLRIDIDRFVSHERCARENLSAAQINAEAWANQLGVMANALLAADGVRSERIRNNRKRVDMAMEALQRRVKSYEDALQHYPNDNPHQLQARKVCDGVTKLARNIEAALTPLVNSAIYYRVIAVTDKGCKP